MIDFIKALLLFFSPFFLVSLLFSFGYENEGYVFLFLSIPYLGYIIYKMYKYAKKLDDYNNKRF